MAMGKMKVTAMVNALFDSFGRSHRAITATVLSSGMVVLPLVLASVVSDAVDGSDIRPWAGAAICCAGPAFGLALHRTAKGDERQRLFMACLVLFVLGCAAAIAPTWAALPPGKGRLLRLIAADPGVLAGAGVGLFALAALGKCVFEAGEGFNRARSAALGDARWLDMAAAAKLFPEDGEIVVGERYRPDPTRSASATSRFCLTTTAPGVAAAGRRC